MADPSNPYPAGAVVTANPIDPSQQYGVRAVSPLCSHSLGLCVLVLCAPVCMRACRHVLESPSVSFFFLHTICSCVHAPPPPLPFSFFRAVCRRHTFIVCFHFLLPTPVACGVRGCRRRQCTVLLLQATVLPRQATVLPRLATVRLHLVRLATVRRHLLLHRAILPLQPAQRRWTPR
jgi:hypothetical protein